MKKTDLVTKIAAVLVFAALACYLGIYFWRSVKNPVVTAIAVETTVRTEMQVSGIVARDELVVESGAAYISLSAQEGHRVAKDSAVAVTYHSEEALQRASRIQELELEIAQTEATLSELVSAEELTARDSAVRAAVLGLTASTARHSVSDIESYALSLRSLLLRGSEETPTAGDLLLQRAELDKLRSSAAQDTEAVPAPASGIFSTLLDGYEYLGTDDLRSLTPSALQAIIEDVREVPEDAIGKLVCSNRWYFAAVVDDGDFSALDEPLAKGDTVRLELGRYYGSELEARVEDIGRAEDGGRVVVFSCARAMGDTLAMRVLSAQVILSEHSGIRVPREAVHTEMNEAGETVYYVYTLTGVQAERKDIQIVWESADYYLAAVGVEGSALREGNDIIVSAKDLYDGKILE